MVNVEPDIEATVESATLKVQIPGELDVGGCNEMVLLEFEPKVADTSPKAPTVGIVGKKAKFIEIEADWYPFAGA